MTKAALVVKPDATYQVIDLDGGLPVLQEAVGGYIENIDVPGMPMFVNDDGLALKLELNQFASGIYHAAFGTTVPIAGPVVIYGGVDAEGENLPLPSHALQMATRLLDLYQASLEPDGD